MKRIALLATLFVVAACTASIDEGTSKDRLWGMDSVDEIPAPPKTMDNGCTELCVPDGDLCKGVSCGTGTTCVDGQCVSGCYLSPCKGVRCADNYFCSAGRCVAIVPGSKACPPGYRCHTSCRPKDACTNVRCGPCQSCVAGKCVENPCACVTCPAGEFCDAGECKASCGCEGGCKSGATCAGGQCLPASGWPGCTPDCANKLCGSADGCGSICKTGLGCAAGTVCKNGTCACVPSCAGKACGADDGCGGTCNSGTCPSGQYCQSGACVGITCACGQILVNGSCVPRCNSGETVCGCNTCCAAGLSCNPTTLACELGIN